jgi:hypothetical protein
MIYRVRLNKKVRNIKVFTMLIKSGQAQNIITRLFMRVFIKKKSEEAAKG